MLSNSLDEIRREKAKFARDVEYLKEGALDDMIDERMEVAESMFRHETMQELEEAAEMLKRLPADEDVVSESAEIERLLNAEENITFEEMIGIE